MERVTISSPLFKSLIVDTYNFSGRGSGIGNIFLAEIKDNKFYLSSANDYGYLESSCSCFPLRVGDKLTTSFCIDSKFLFDLAKTLKDEQDLEFEIDNPTKPTKISFTIGKSVYKISLISKDEFNYSKSPFSQTDLLISEKVPFESLIKSVSKQILPFTMPSQSQYGINALVGVKFIFDSSKNELTLFSSDRYRVSKMTYNGEGITKSTSFVLPTEVVSYLSKIQISSLLIVEDGNLIKFSIQSGVGEEIIDKILVCKTVHGDYPNFDTLFDTDKFHITLRFATKDLLEMVKTLYNFSDEINNAVEITFDQENNVASLLTEHVGRGIFAKDIIPFEKTYQMSTGESDPEWIKEIVVNCLFLKEALDAIKGEEVTIYLDKDIKGKIIITPSDPIENDPKFIHSIALINREI